MEQILGGILDTGGLGETHELGWTLKLGGTTLIHDLFQKPKFFTCVKFPRTSDTRRFELWPLASESI